MNTMEEIKKFIEIKFNEQNKFIEQLINKQNKYIENTIAEYKKEIEQVMVYNTIEVQTIATEMGAKIDIMCNIDKPSVSSTKTTTKVNKILTKNAFFKDKLKKNINEYIDVLYTENDLNELKNNTDVISKKTDILKKNKIIDILYNNITKIDSGKNIILKNIYDKYKQDQENEDEETNVDEEI
jgi:hypothetical protein